MFKSIYSQEFREFEDSVRRHPRGCGDYIIDLVSVEGFRESGMTDNELVGRLVEHWNHGNESYFPPSWFLEPWLEGHEFNRDWARENMIEMLVGGNAIGWKSDFMTATQAARYFDQFCHFFSSNARFFTGLGIGDKWYVFLHGILFLDEKVAGLLWIEESD